ncbi:MAG: pullulanase [Bacteroidetes bacterium]|nr:pullulanase [Bacteroidota bacterium]
MKPAVKSLCFLFIITFLFINIHQGNTLFILDKNPAKQSSQKNIDSIKLKPLDEYFSNKKLGSFVENGKTTFRIFTPSSVRVQLVVFNNVEDHLGEVHDLVKDEDGVWEVELSSDLSNKFYGYKFLQANDDLDLSQKPLCIDPYSRAVASFTTYNNPRKSIVYSESYDWQGDTWIKRDWRDLIIYEMHVRDMTAHKSSGAKKPGTYNGLTEKEIPGGINYIKDIGVNTVELLPAMEFGNCEIPYRDSLDGKFNTWNPYERNHWGYMTSAFFAPSSYYAMDWDELKWNEWMGADARQVNDFKDMVKAFHKEGIAVMMDVVYNHLSEYEFGNLKQIDKDYYFRLDENGNYVAESYCGNDIKTERPMMRKMIVESILFWMKEYHVDGFRFDLGKLIDWETIEEIIREARKVNPNVIIVCEPWGGGYDPQGFSLREWGSWNDQIRNGIKGENPKNGLGWIFGKWYGNNSIDRVKSYVHGTLINFEHGLFQKKEHSVNYLAAHDGYTLGDFIRIASKEVDETKTIKNINAHVKLTEKQKKYHKLGAMFLFTSQGITMIHSGQEFARSKVVPFDVAAADKNKGKIDHNSYDKDNETNYINYEHAEINSDLLNYYKGLIEFRKTFEGFRRAEIKDISFFEVADNEFAFGYQLNYKNDTFAVLFNASPVRKQNFILLKGKWSVLIDENFAGAESIRTLTGTVALDKTTGMVLKLINSPNAKGLKL